MGNPGLVGRGWITALDFDLTANGSQTLSPDGNYTIGGLQWNKQNSANDSVAMAITAGTGVVVQPVAATNYSGSTRSLPTLWLPFSQIPALTQLDWNSAIRIWAHISASNTNANFDEGIVALDSNAAGAYGIQCDRGIASGGAPTQTFTLQQQVSGGLVTPGTGFISGNGLTLGGTNNVAVLDMPSLAGGLCRILYGGFGLASGKTWPDFQALVPNVMSVGTASGYNTFTANTIPYNIPPSQLLGLAIGAKRQNSATALSVTFAHVRVDYKN